MDKSRLQALLSNPKKAIEEIVISDIASSDITFIGRNDNQERASFIGDLEPSPTIAPFTCKLLHTLPNINRNNRGFSAFTIRNSVGSIKGNLIDLEHRMKDYGAESDKVIGFMAGFGFPSGTEVASAVPEMAIPVYMDGVLFRRVEGVDDLIQQHLEGKIKYKTSMECLFVPEEGSIWWNGQFWPLDARPEFAEWRSWLYKDLITIDGERAAYIYGGENGFIYIHGAGITAEPADEGAEILQMAANLQGGESIRSHFESKKIKEGGVKHMEHYKTFKTEDEFNGFIKETKDKAIESALSEGVVVSKDKVVEIEKSMISVDGLKSILSILTSTDDIDIKKIASVSTLIDDEYKEVIVNIRAKIAEGAIAKSYMEEKKKEEAELAFAKRMEEVKTGDEEIDKRRGERIGEFGIDAEGELAFKAYKKELNIPEKKEQEKGSKEEKEAEFAKKEKNLADKDIALKDKEKTLETEKANLETERKKFEEERAGFGAITNDEESKEKIYYQ